MAVKLTFTTVANRRSCHQYIQEAAREIEASTPLLETLFELENGVKKDTPAGFGYTKLNSPEHPTVTYPHMDEERFTSIIEQLDAAPPAELGDPDDEQLERLAEYLSDVAEMMRDAKHTIPPQD